MAQKERTEEAKAKCGARKKAEGETYGGVLETGEQMMMLHLEQIVSNDVR